MSIRRLLIALFLVASARGFASAPVVRVALLVDTSEGVTPAGLSQVRSAIDAFIDALAPDVEVTLIATGRRTQVRVEPTTDHKKLKDSASGLLTDGGPTPLMATLLETDKRFMHEEDRTPVFVIVTGDGSESSPNVNDRFNAWLGGLAARHAVVHAFVLKYKSDGMPDQVANAATRATHGRYETLGTAGPLAAKMKTLAGEIGR